MQNVATVTAVPRRAAIPDPRPPRHRTALVLGSAALLLGAWAAWYYHVAGLTLSHYDSKGHLVVARRVLDSLTPGWKQIGAVWLPLPHLLNVLPVQIDWCYRTGASAVLMSVLSFGAIVYACARLVLHVTRSVASSAIAALIVALNPDILYLQATPMTEPLLLALTTLGVALLVEWVEADGTSRRWPVGLVLAAAMLTRYEAWPLVAAALALAAFALWWKGLPVATSIARAARLAAYPAAAVVAFLVQSRLTVGHWFVTGGFYVADNPDMGRPLKTVGSIWWASHHMNPYAVLIVAAFGAPVTAISALRRRAPVSAILVLALAATAALPWFAFFSGHPFRYRYMVPLVPALAVYCGCLIGLTPRRARGAFAAAFAVLVLWQVRPLNARAPMVLEAQLDRSNSAQRFRAVTPYLVEHRRAGGKVLASFASLSHYVQELSREGFAVRDFVHEGNGGLWTEAIEHPRDHVDWILIEELSEGGDVLAKRTRNHPEFLDGFRRVAEGGGVALYERSEPARLP